jgi:hypothetical protein
MYNILLEKVNKKLDATDYQMAKDFLDYYAIEPDEIHRYIDEFVVACYTYNEQTGEHEQNTPDKLPFADVEHLDNGWTKYTYGNTSISKMEK